MNGPNPQKGAVVSIDRQRRAVQDLIIGDKSIAQIARESGVSERTIRRWRDRPEVRSALLHRQKEPSEPAGSIIPAQYQPATPSRAHQPSGQGAVRDALRLPADASELDWFLIGKTYPPPGMDPEQSSLIFQIVARGNPLVIAANRAGFGDDEPEIWRSRAKEDPRWLDWFTAVGMALGAAIDRLGQRVQDGMSGWQGSARQLISLRPDVFNVKDLMTSVGNSSLDQLDADSLLSVIEVQIKRSKGQKIESRPSDEVIPLSETGMNDEEGEP